MLASLKEPPPPPPPQTTTTPPIPFIPPHNKNKLCRAAPGPLGGDLHASVFSWLEKSSINNTTLNPAVLSIKSLAGRYSRRRRLLLLQVTAVVGGVTKALAPTEREREREWRKHRRGEMSCHYSSTQAPLMPARAHPFCLLPQRSSCLHKYIITPRRPPR